MIKGCYRINLVRKKFKDGLELYETNSRRPFSFAVPPKWPLRQARYLKRLKKILEGRPPFERI